MASKETASGRQYHKGNVAEDLLIAARRILQTETVEDLSVRRLAREVGMTPANFYNHFESLKDLLLELGAEAFRERASTLAHIRRTSKTRAEAIRRSATTYLDLAISNHQLFRIMFGLIPDAQQHKDFRVASDQSMSELVHTVYGEDISDSSDIYASRERCKVAYGVLAIGYGLARIIMEGAVPFSPERQPEMRRFVEGVVDALIAGELGRLAAE